MPGPCGVDFADDLTDEFFLLGIVILERSPGPPYDSSWVEGCSAFLAFRDAEGCADGSDNFDCFDVLDLFILALKFAL